MDDSADTKQSMEMDDIAETATDETANHKDEKYEEGEHFPPTCRKSVDENANTAPTNITTTCFGKTRLKPLLKKFVLRAMMILHSVLAAWRVVISRGDHRFWALVAGNVIWAVEIFFSIKKWNVRKQSRWRPSFVVYLLLLLPAIWLLQLHQYDVARSEQPTQNTTGSEGSTLDNLLNIEGTTWIVVIQETLIYVLLVGRWLNDDVAGKNLSQQLMNFLASASDIMELYALFDLPVVQTHFPSTIAVLAIWSSSFIQFIPVLTRTKNRSNAVADSSPPSIEAGENRKSAPSSQIFDIAEVVLAFLFQDGPFLAIRLFIIINFKTITHSLFFFVIKNFITIMLLIYRLAVLLKAKPGKKQQ